MPEPIKYHTAEQEMERLEISRSTLKRMVALGCPREKLIGQTYRFIPSAVDDWIAGRQKLGQPLAQAVRRQRGRRRSGASPKKVDLSAYVQVV